jgi:hypothetical protein
MAQFLYSSIYGFNQLLQPLFVPFCFVAAWSLVAIVAWSLWTATRDSIKVAQQMHQIPCANCQFFTNSHYLKCPVHPSWALSEEAVNCTDYEPATYGTKANSEQAYY